MRNDFRSAYAHNTDIGFHYSTFSYSKERNTDISDSLPEILFISSYPPRECGIATYTKDLIQSLNEKFSNSFCNTVCALESSQERHEYNEIVQYVLNVDVPGEWISLANEINQNDAIEIVVIQHEFGLFALAEKDFIQFLRAVKKQIVIVFHTVLPKPEFHTMSMIQEMVRASNSIIVMTNRSKEILITDYFIPKRKVSVIPHGTHLISHEDKQSLKFKYQLSNRLVLSTFGLLSSGKSIETTLRAMPEIASQFPSVMFLIIGKTHPSVRKRDGEAYREMLQSLVVDLGLERHVQFINHFLPLFELLEYLQLTDLYLFTSKDPNQAVSGTFAYAISCGCSIVSTPIPFARELMPEDNGNFFEYGNSDQLAKASIRLLHDKGLRHNISMAGLHSIASTAWENSANLHALLFGDVCNHSFQLKFDVPEIRLNHLKRMTTDFGLIQFAKLNQPDIKSGYTLDDNARALIVIIMHYELTGSEEDLVLIQRYYEVIKYCFQPEGDFLNYINENYQFTEQNNEGNLEDSNGRAIWALGYLVSLRDLLPVDLVKEANEMLDAALLSISKIHSSRAMSFIIKGLYYRSKGGINSIDTLRIQELADRLVQMYRHESNKDWHWYESYLTYGNAILPEAMLCAWLVTGNEVYRETAYESFEFLLYLTFEDGNINIISNNTWLHKSTRLNILSDGGEQPIDVAYTIVALQLFYHEFKFASYRKKLESAFEWFLGKNHLHQIIYNPCTGGCYDGLEKNNVNLNQGAESTLSYLISRFTLEFNRMERSVLENTEHNRSPFPKEQIIHLIQ